MKKIIWAGLIVLVAGLAFSASYYLMAADKSRRIVVFLPSAQNPFWIEVRRGIESAASELGEGFQVDVLASGDLDASSQVEQLQSTYARGSVNAIVIGVANNRAPASIISKYNAANIPVIMIDTKLDESAAKQAGASWSAFIGSDNRIGGERAAKAMIKALGENGARVLLIKGSYVHQSAIDRAEGFIAGAGSQLEIVEREGEWSRERAAEITTGVMTREPVKGIFASNDDMALGAVAALKNLGISGSDYPAIIGFDATPNGMAAIENGEMYATVKQDARGMGSAGVLLARDLIEGKEVPEDTLIPVNVVPKDRAP